MMATTPMEAILQSPFSPLLQISRGPVSFKPESSSLLPVYLPIPAAYEDCNPAAPAAKDSPTWVPPQPRPASQRDKDPRYRMENPRQVPKFHAEQSKRIAKIALDYYNKRKKMKFELLEVRPVNSVPTKWRPYMHINFVAKSSKKGSRQQLFFAELYLCGKRRSRSGYSVICCEPLTHGSPISGRLGMDKPAANPLRKNLDFTYCYACDQNMMHPKGTNYVAGHCNIRGIYNGVAML